MTRILAFTDCTCPCRQKVAEKSSSPEQTAWEVSSSNLGLLAAPPKEILGFEIGFSRYYFQVFFIRE
jgi:hypothetical protein